MLVVSKESFYVLSHVCQEMGECVEAQKCLDRIERYIDEQRKKEEELYVKTMKHAGELGDKVELTKSSMSSIGSSSDLALAGKLS